MPIPYYRKYKKARSREDLKPNKPMQSWRSDKKMVVLAKVGNKTKVIHFGDPKMQDYTMHGDKQRRANYLSRSAGIRDGNGRLTRNNKLSANYWARKVLW